MKKILLLMCFVSGMAYAQTSISLREVTESYLPAYSATLPHPDIEKIARPHISDTKDEIDVRSEIVKLLVEEKDGTTKIIHAIKISLLKTPSLTGYSRETFYINFNGEKIKEGILVEKL